MPQSASSRATRRSTLTRWTGLLRRRNLALTLARVLAPLLLLGYSLAFLEVIGGSAFAWIAQAPALVTLINSVTSMIFTLSMDIAMVLLSVWLRDAITRKKVKTQQGEMIAASVFLIVLMTADAITFFLFIHAVSSQNTMGTLLLEVIRTVLAPVTSLFLLIFPHREVTHDDIQQSLETRLGETAMERFDELPLNDAPLLSVIQSYLLLRLSSATGEDREIRERQQELFTQVVHLLMPSESPEVGDPALGDDQEPMKMTQQNQTVQPDEPYLTFAEIRQRHPSVPLATLRSIIQKAGHVRATLTKEPRTYVYPQSWVDMSLATDGFSLRLLPQEDPYSDA